MSHDNAATCGDMNSFSGARCQREPDHDGPHVGAVFGGETHQWAELDQPEPMPEPMWAHAMPVGATVDVETDSYKYESVQLSGVVLDDHEQPAAIRVSWRESEQGVPRHAILPWRTVLGIEWGAEL